MSAPVDPNRKPVIRRRVPSLCTIRTMGLPSPNIRMTTERPTDTNRAVPIISDRNGCQGKIRLLLWFIACELASCLCFQDRQDRMQQPDM